MYTDIPTECEHHLQRDAQHIKIILSYVIYQTATEPNSAYFSCTGERDANISATELYVCTGRRDRDSESADPNPSLYVHCPSSHQLCAAVLRNLGPRIPHNGSERASLFAVCHSTPASLCKHDKREESISSCFSSAFKRMTTSSSLHSICQNSLYL
jgi:hypothetical protein